VPDTLYTSVGDADVAYQVIGDGDIDVLFGWGLGSHLELQWAHPAWAGVLERFASFSRLILFDRRGTGMSDRLARNTLPRWEEWNEDMLAVLDAVGSARAAVVAVQDNGPMAMMFAAMHPERVRALVLVGTAARMRVADDYLIGYPPPTIEAMVEFLETNWATPQLLGVGNPSRMNDSHFADWWTSMYRAAMTPRTAAAQFRHILDTDVREALGLIRVPTLVIHWTDNPIIPLAHARYVADHIDGAQLVILPGTHLWPDPFDPDPFFEPVTEFLTGTPTVEVDRVLANVLFTDIVGSTDRLAQVGDSAYRHLLDAHDDAVRNELRRYAGREVNTTGDGFFAAFDGPTRAIRCALAIVRAGFELGVEVRAGLHSGECVVRGDDLSGLAVHIASRVGAAASPGEVLVSSTVKDLVAGSGVVFSDRGDHELKGVPAPWRLFRVISDAD
jgi:class 3 adenylate cyclase/pimeloyl-ACP methyl ester carboxylesterase